MEKDPDIYINEYIKLLDDRNRQWKETIEDIIEYNVNIHDLH